MSRWKSRALWMMLAVALVVTFQACTDSTGDGDDGDNLSLSNPAVFEATMRQTFLPIVNGIADGLERVLVALAGGTGDGVVFTPTGNGADAAIGVDFDGDGSRESLIDASIVGDVGVGATLSINAVTTAEPSAYGSGSMTIMETQPGVVLLDQMSGGGGADPPGSMNAADVVVSDGTVTVDAVTGMVSGSMTMTIFAEEEELPVSITFEPDGAGGFRIRFSGSGINFTIP